MKTVLSLFLILVLIFVVKWRWFGDNTATVLCGENQSPEFASFRHHTGT